MHAALSLLEADVFAAAAFPLFEAELVDALIFSPDGAFVRALPDWCEALLDHYAGAGRLSAHGVAYSPFSARFEERQRVWLAGLARETKRRRYVRFSEHVGFTTAGPYDRGAPMPVPFCAGALDAARASLARLRDACGGLPVGLENLALAFSPLDVDSQGALLEALTGSEEDFVVLDLHNLHCQAVNYGRDPLALLAGYPLSRVKEIHVAGGRWSFPASDPERRPFRRDTHDGAVPDEVFVLLEAALARCPAVEMVVLEALPVSLGDESARARFRADFRRLREIVHAPRAALPAPSAPPTVHAAPAPFPASLAELERLQPAMLARFHERTAPEAIAPALAREHPAFAGWLGAAEPRALEIAVELAATWGHRSEGG